MIVIKVKYCVDCPYYNCEDSGSCRKHDMSYMKNSIDVFKYIHPVCSFDRYTERLELVENYE